jgi:hypothetical protein
MKDLILQEDFKVIEGLLPKGYRHQARRCGATQRMRGIPYVRDLFRVLMLHVSGGLSLEQTCVRAAELHLGQITPAALLRRLQHARPWFVWMCERMVAEGEKPDFKGTALEGRRVLAVDGSNISEPGAEGSSWSLHYALGLPALRCEHAAFTSHETGESLKNFPVKKGDVVLADRAYGKRGQLAWLMERGADAIVRVTPWNFPAVEGAETDIKFDWAGHLRRLRGHTPGDWTAWFEAEGKRRSVRVCAVRKSEAARREAVHAIEVEARKKGNKVQPETLEYAGYVIVLTTLRKAEVSTAQVLELYRCRWQVELAFKRLKSLLDGGWVPKVTEESALAWMQGKVLEALLVEKLLEKARVFFSYGHDMRE